MKSVFAKLTLAAVAVLAPAAISAQNSQAIVEGTATVVLTPAVLQQFTALGVTVTNLSPARTQVGTNVLPALEGVIDLDTSSNEVVYGGGYQLKVGSNTLQIRNLTLDLFNSSAIFYGIVVENGTFVGREAIFSISASGPPQLPIVPDHGTISHNGLTLNFQQPFITLLNGVVGNSGLNTTTPIGTLNLFSVLAPLSPSESSWPFPFGR